MEQQILPFGLITDQKIDEMEFVRLFQNCKGPLIGNAADLKDIKCHARVIDIIFLQYDPPTQSWLVQ